MHLDLLTYKTLLAQPGRLAMVVLNAIGAILYAILASHSWAIPEERELHSTTGEPFVWALYVLPIFALFAVLNLPGGTHPRPPTMAKRKFVATDSAGLACCRIDRFRAPLKPAKVPYAQTAYFEPIAGQLTTDSNLTWRTSRAQWSAGLQ